MKMNLPQVKYEVSFRKPKILLSAQNLWEHLNQFNTDSFHFATVTGLAKKTLDIFAN